MHSFLLVVDMQKDFIDGALGSADAKAIVGCVVQRVEDALREGRTLLFTQDTHDADYMAKSEGRHLPVPHCLRGTEGWALHEALQPYATRTIEKPTFGSLSLIELLEGVSEDAGANLDIELCGVCTDICVVSNALLIRAHLPEAVLRVHANCCAGTSAKRHEAALDVMRSCHVEVV